MIDWKALDKAFADTKDPPREYMTIGHERGFTSYEVADAVFSGAIKRAYPEIREIIRLEDLD